MYLCIYISQLDNVPVLLTPKQRIYEKCYSSKTRLYGFMDCTTKLQCIVDVSTNEYQTDEKLWLISLCNASLSVMGKLTLEIGIENISRPKIVTREKVSIFREHMIPSDHVQEE